MSWNTAASCSTARLTACASTPTCRNSISAASAASEEAIATSSNIAAAGDGMAELEIDGLTLRFGGLTVLDRVSLAVAAGELFALSVFSALSGMRLLACLIVAPQRGYDEPATLSYAISSFCPTSADGLQVNLAAALGDESLGKRGEGCRASPLLR